MIIFGSRTRSALVAALVFSCALCHSVAAQRLYRVRTWFTLLFAPVFPFGHGRYVMQCSYCGQTTPLDRPNAERFTADAEATQQALRAHDTLPAQESVPAPPSLPVQQSASAP